MLECFYTQTIFGRRNRRSVSHALTCVLLDVEPCPTAQADEQHSALAIHGAYHRWLRATQERHAAPLGPSFLGDVIAPSLVDVDNLFYTKSDRLKVSGVCWPAGRSTGDLKDWRMALVTGLEFRSTQ